MIAQTAPRAEPAGGRLGPERRWPASATRRKSCAFGAEGHRKGSQGAAVAEGTASGAAAAVNGRRRRRAVVARLGAGRWPAATTGWESCAFAAEEHRRRGPRAAAAEGTASGAAEAAATWDGDALGRPQLIAIVGVVGVACVHVWEAKGSLDPEIPVEQAIFYSRQLLSGRVKFRKCNYGS